MSSLPVDRQILPMESEARNLQQAFHAFNEISRSLERAYSELQRKVNQLSSELEVTNYYLTSLLQSLPCGVMVINESRQVTLMNRMAARFFSAQDLKLPVPLACVFRNADFSENAVRTLSEFRDATEIKVQGESDFILLCSWSRMRGGERALVVQDVSEMRKLEAEKQKAERVSAMGEMALEVAHEIRNPLGALELFAELLQDRDLEPAERDRYLGQIQLGVRSLNSVLTNMLSFSKGTEPVLSRVEADVLLDELIAFMSPLLEQRDISVIRRLRPGSAILGDREMLRQIFLNLITNALQALPRGGGIEVETARRDGEIIVVIADNGVGIPESAHQKIFDPGFSRNSQGNGLGLAIVQRLLQSHAATIRVESTPGEGSRFLLRFRAFEERS